MKKTHFLLGLVSGVVIAHNWRFLAKEGIKGGIKAGRSLKELSQRAMEDIEDIAAEATAEASERPPQEPKW